jgi:hypothetical protein
VLDGDARANDDGLAEHHLRVAFDTGVLHELATTDAIAIRLSYPPLSRDHRVPEQRPPLDAV